jgi:carboxymethylenebutenolidase
VSDAHPELTDLQRYLVEEYAEDYQHGQMSRRQALKFIAAVMGSLVTANAFLTACTAPPATSDRQAASTGMPSAGTGSTVASPAPALTQTPTQRPGATPQALATQAVIITAATLAVQPGATPTSSDRVAADDAAVSSNDVQIPGSNGQIMAYVARPAAAGKYPAVLVCHENRGLTDYIRDVTRRLAKAGYLGVAVDLLWRIGGTANVKDASQIPGTLGNTPPEQFVADFRAAADWLHTQPDYSPGHLGMVGFCFGGGITWRTATALSELRAAVPFYGPNPPLDAVPGIQAAVLGIYGAEDQRIDAGIPDIEAAMKANGKSFTKQVYAGANHAFHNDTGQNYRPEQAQAAWKLTLQFLAQHVR